MKNIRTNDSGWRVGRGREARCVYGGEKKHTNILKGLKI